MTTYNDLFSYVQMGAGLKDALSSSFPDFQKLSALMSFDLRKQEMNAAINEQYRQASIAQQNAVIAQQQAAWQAGQVQAAKANKIQAIRALQTFTNQQADLNAAFAIGNAQSLADAAASELAGAGKSAMAAAGKVRTAFGGSAIVADTGTALDMVKTVVDETMAQGYNRYKERFNQAQKAMNDYTIGKLSQSYNNFNADQQAYFTSIMG